MRIYDVSMTIHPRMAVWKRNQERLPVFTIERDFDVDGTGSRQTRVSLDMHTGTHVDAPLHFLAHGSPIENTGLDKLVRPVRVLDLTNVEDKITRLDLENFRFGAGDFLLLKTKNSYVDEFDFEFVYLERTGAAYLVEREIAGVGIDALGIDRSQADHATHKQLLSNEIVIIEGLRLGDVPAGDYFMVALPLKLQGVEAAPARVILFGVPENEGAAQER
ncbi:MAG: cyclase family protein [Firmicutes bacterium]|nr:cyclase family protein [Bacillota bacterium]NLL87878.1 cyclase family protein [Bacillota bacterium]HKM18409.1 cyclase family protein [Limnochordia bacterium]